MIEKLKFNVHDRVFDKMLHKINEIIEFLNEQEYENKKDKTLENLAKDIKSEFIGEKCQLMREIYKETDIEPDMWHDYNPDFGTIYDAWTAKQKTVMGAQVHKTGEKFEFTIEFHQPWYPLEQVLKHLTPDVQNTVLMHHDYHLTALKLWKQTLEEKLCMNK